MKIGHRKAHAQEILGEAQIVERIDERLAGAVFERHRRDGRDFGDQAVACDLALARIVDVGRVVIEGRQRTHNPAHDRHRMRVAPEAAEEGGKLLVHHRMHGDGAVESLHLLLRRQFAVKQQVTHLQEIRMRRELVDRVAAVKQNAFVAVDEGDLAFAACRGCEAGIVGEHIRLAIKLADVDHVRAFMAGENRKLVFPVAVGQLGCAGGSGFACSDDHLALLSSAGHGTRRYQRATPLILQCSIIQVCGSLRHLFRVRVSRLS
jgi:hypothetical protein